MTSPQTQADDERLASTLIAWADTLNIPSGDFVNQDLRQAASRISTLSSEVERLRAVLKPAERELTDLVEWLGPCDHEVGVCHCKARDTRDGIRTALATQEKQG